MFLQRGPKVCKVLFFCFKVFPSGAFADDSDWVFGVLRICIRFKSRYRVLATLCGGFAQGVDSVYMGCQHVGVVSG